jgi:hypothetical protein
VLAVEAEQGRFQGAARLVFEEGDDARVWFELADFEPEVLMLVGFVDGAVAGRAEAEIWLIALLAGVFVLGLVPEGDFDEIFGVVFGGP